MRSLAQKSQILSDLQLGTQFLSEILPFAVLSFYPNSGLGLKKKTSSFSVQAASVIITLFNIWV